jgi:hypothetical protein
MLLPSRPDLESMTLSLELPQAGHFMEISFIWWEGANYPLYVVNCQEESAIPDQLFCYLFGIALAYNLLCYNKLKDEARGHRLWFLGVIVLT